MRSIAVFAKTADGVERVGGRLGQAGAHVGLEQVGGVDRVLAREHREPGPRDRVLADSIAALDAARDHRRDEAAATRGPTAVVTTSAVAISSTSARLLGAAVDRRGSR